MEHLLQNSKILVTREEKQAKSFSEKIRLQGGVPIEVPLLKISCKDGPEMEDFFQHMVKFNWIFFTSANGVECFYRLAEAYDIKPSDVAKNIAVVGHKTELALTKFGLHASFIPHTYNADTMAEEFLAEVADPKSLLLVRGNKSRDVLPYRFQEHGLDFYMVEVYETSTNYQMKEQLVSTLEKETIDFVTFTSPSTVEAYNEMGIPVETNYVCIGTTTEKRAKELGFSPVLTPDEFTIEGMVCCMGRYISMKG